MRFGRLCVSVVMVVMLSACGSFGATQEEFRAALRRAEAGDSDAQFEVGVMYCYGDGVEQDYKAAYEWFLKAANRGDIEAQYNMGVLYYHGQGVKQDYKTSREWFLKAADRGDAISMLEIGRLYDRGLGVEQDYKTAREWYQKAADRGEARAMTSLGDLYVTGRGGKQDYNTARAWYLKAANLGNSQAMLKLGIMFELGWLYEMEQDYNAAREWYLKAANLGNARAMFNLGVLYDNGRGVKANEKEAFNWYQKSAKKGDDWGLCALGRIYELGHSVKKDVNKAIELYKQSYAKGNTSAQWALERLNALAKPATPKTPAKQPATAQTSTRTPRSNTGSRSRPRIAVRAFEDRSEEGGAPADAIMNMMISELNGTGAFSLIEREHLDELVSEIQLGQSGLVDRSTAITVGKLQSPEYTIMGAVTLYYYSEKASGFAFPIIGTSTKAKTAYVVLDIRIINSTTGEIVYASSQIGEATNLDKKSPANRSKMIGGLLSMAMRDSVKKHVSAINAQAW